MDVAAWIFSALAYLAWLAWSSAVALGTIPAPPLILVGLFAMLVGAVAIVILRIRRGSRRVRWLWLSFVPVTIFLTVGIAVGMPISVAHAVLPDGRTLHLAQEPVPTDTVYGLWLDSMGGLVWSRVDADLSYSEDGSFIGDESLAVSQDGHRVLVKRGGVWTDCLDISSNLLACDLPSGTPIWGEADYHARMREHSSMLEEMM